MFQVIPFDALLRDRELAIIFEGTAYNEDTFTDYTVNEIRQWVLSNRLDFLTSIDGQFIIAFVHKGVVSLIRDPMGKRPLFYSMSREDGIIISDDFKKISNWIGAKELNTSVLQSYKGIGFNLFPGETIFKKISAVPPGHITTLGVGRQLKSTPYKQRNYNNESVTADLVQHTLDTSIQRCVSKSKTALFFSGGLDSSYLLAKGREFGEITPFTLWDGVNNADLEDAQILAHEESIPLVAALASPEIIEREIVDYAWNFAMPMGGSGFDLLGGVAFHILAKEIAKDGLKSAICGEGADELFLGYHQYHMDPQTLVEKLKRRIAQFNLSALDNRLIQFNLYSDAQQSLRTIAATFGLSEYHLPSVYASASSSGLSITPPFLSFKLRAFINSFPEESLIDRTNNWTKVLLRKFFRTIRPSTMSRAAIRRKRSMAYSVLSMDDYLNSTIIKSGTRLTKEEIFWRLFFFLHVENSFTTPPQIMFSDIIHLLEKTEVPI